MVGKKTDARPGGMGTVLVPSSLNISALEHAMALWQHANEWNSDLVFDLRDAAWIDIAALLHILSIVSQRCSENLHTIIRVPENKSARDFIKRWGFPEAIHITTGVSFQNFLDERDLSYVDEPQTTYSVGSVREGLVSPDGEIVTRLFNTRFFGFVPFASRKDGPQLDDLISQEIVRWRGNMIQAVLRKHLRGPALDVPRVLIFESLANAKQHPNASVVCCVSHLSSPGVKDDRGLFTLCFWDNGAGIISTLRDCLDEGLPIRNGSISQESEVQFLFDMTEDSEHRTVVENTSFTPNSASPNAEILFSSILPGITRKMAREVPPILFNQRDQRDGESVVEVASVPGMGLFALTRSVIQSFSGSLAFRTGNYFMSVKRPKYRERSQYNVDYTVKVVRRPSWELPFHGNMLTLRIPSRRG